MTQRTGCQYQKSQCSCSYSCCATCLTASSNACRWYSDSARCSNKYGAYNKIQPSTGEEVRLISNCNGQCEPTQAPTTPTTPQPSISPTPYPTCINSTEPCPTQNSYSGGSSSAGSEAIIIPVIIIFIIIAIVVVIYQRKRQNGGDCGSLFDNQRYDQPDGKPMAPVQAQPANVQPQPTQQQPAVVPQPVMMTNGQQPVQQPVMMVPVQQQQYPMVQAQPAGNMRLQGYTPNGQPIYTSY